MPFQHTIHNAILSHLPSFTALSVWSSSLSPFSLSLSAQLGHRAHAVPQAECTSAVQLLLAGCHDAVHVYRIHIDDASQRSSEALAIALDRVAAGEDCQIQLNSPSGTHRTPADPPGGSGSTNGSHESLGESGGEVSGQQERFRILDEQHLVIQAQNGVRVNPLLTFNYCMCMQCRVGLNVESSQGSKCARGACVHQI